MVELHYSREGLWFHKYDDSGETFYSLLALNIRVGGQNQINGIEITIGKLLIIITSKFIHELIYKFSKSKP